MKVVWLANGNRRQAALVAMALLFLMIFAVAVGALTLNSVAPSWANPVGSSGPVTCQNFQTVGAEQQIRYGDDDANGADCPTDPTIQSGLGFEGTASPATFSSGTPFLLGEITHYNRNVIASSTLESVDLDLNIAFGDPVYSDVFTAALLLDETANFLNTCPYGDTQPCADRITLNRTSTQFTAGGNDYEFEILGMIPGTAGSCAYADTQISTTFISEEDATNTACVFGRLTLDENAQVLVTKDTDPLGITTVSPGDILDFKIDYECSSITSSCRGVQLFDFLPDAFEFVGATGSIHFDQGVYSENNNSILWNLRSSLADVLSAGSTGFVRVRVRVRNDGTVPNNFPIDNVVVSTLDNGPTSTNTYTVTNMGSSNWTVNKLNASTVYLDTNAPQTDVSYTVQICSSGSTVNLLNAQMVDTLPPGSVFVSASGGGVYDPGPPQTVAWDLGDLAASSGCTSRQVTVQFPESTFTESQSVTNSVDGTGDPVGEPTWTDTDSVTNPLQRFQPLPNGTIAKNVARTDWVVGATLSFGLEAENTGNIPLQNFTITDTVPPEFDVTSVTTGGANEVRYQTNLSGGYVIWNAPYTVSSLGLGAGEYITSVQWVLNTINPGGTLNPAISGTIIDPANDGNPVNVGDTVTNTADLTYDFLDSPGGPGSGGAGPAGASINIVVLPVPNFDKGSVGGISSQWRFLIGQQVGYYVLFVNNDTGVPLDNVTIIDNIPDQFEVTEVTSGTYYNSGGVTVTVSYQTNLSGGFVPLGSSPASSNATFSIPALASGEYITNIRWQYGTVPIAFSANSLPRINGTVIDPDNTGAPVNDNDSMSNDATMDWSYQGIPNSRGDSTIDPVREPRAVPSVDKSTLTSGPYIPTQIVTYQLRVGAASNSPSVLINPIVMDLLPAGLLYMPVWAWDPGDSGVAAPTFEEIPNYNFTGQTLLRWTFNGTFPQGHSGNITFNAGIAAGASQGNLENIYYVTSDDVPLLSGDPDTNDLDGNGDDGNLIAGSGTTILIDELVGLDSVKAVLGELDSAYSVYPNSGRTLTNGDITYRLRIINQGNIPINNVKVVDILPFVGDTGVRDTSPRLSAWRPVLTGLVAAPPGVTVYYSTSSNPCRPDIVSSGPAGCTAPNWSPLPPSAITTVQSLRFDFAGILDPGETFEFTWNMQAPPDAAEGSIAWNSFAFTSTNANTGIPLRPAEPNKVGIEIETLDIAPRIDLEKATNTVDADLPTGPLVPVGDPVTWTYVITNTGNTRLANVTLTDDQLGPITCAEADPIPVLETVPPGNTFTCTAPAGIAAAGQYANIGTVEGTPVDGSGAPLIDPDTSLPVPPVSATDPSHYYGFNPALARLGDFVWIDSDGNGVQDGGEPGLPGITVNLYATSDLLNPIDTTTTDGSGLYNFVDIDVSVTGNSYVVEFVLPPLYSFTDQDQGSDTADSDADVITGRTTTIPLNAGDDDRTWDAGVVPPASIGDLVWIDSDGDGAQDAGENGIENVTVNLYSGAGVLQGTTVTDVDGIYSFTDLEPGDYYVEFVLPANYIFTRQNNSGDAATDSDADLVSGQTIVTTLTAGENDPTWDAGIIPPARIGDRVWEDLDADGTQDGGESGIPNVTVELFNGAGVSQGTTTTDSTGSYSFTNLLPGDYYLVFTPPTDYEFSPQDNSGNDATDSDANITTGQTVTTTLSVGETDNSWDAGMFRRASIGDYVWADADFDGIQDSGEPAFANITVELFNGAGVSQGTDITDASGLYLFDNLIPGSYYLVFTPPANYDVTLPNQGGNDAVDSDPAIATNQTSTTQLTSNEDDMTWDAGLVQLATLGDYVWEDINGDGIQDGGEPLIQGVTVQLYNLSNTLIATDVTDASGLYLFTDVYPGSYYLHFVAPNGYAITQINQGGNDAVDSDAAPANGNTGTINLSPGEDDRDWDAGLYRPASLGNFVWRDFDRDGIQDGGATEYGIVGVVVNLYDSGDNFIATTTTDSNGSYNFTNLAPGTYYVEFVLPTVGWEFTLQDQGGSDAVDSDADFSSGQTATTTLDSGDNDLTLDAGLFPLASIGDFVWHDLDADGVQDSGEPGVANVTVTLYDSTDTQVGAPTTTNGTGFYQFVNLQPGDYYV
ncbi:MAG: carboxypeptidase regulatory-like domain-containing protein, partial [Anaerolineae bacterium]|nr:carboxypeptidase regulatory-like domain-containing protein [Anaerolineae bacterium]